MGEMEVSDQIEVRAALPPEEAPLVPIGLKGGWAPDPLCELYLHFHMHFHSVKHI